MKWMLIILVFGGSPVKTDLLYDTLDACLKAEDMTRATYARAFDAWEDWARKNASEANYPRSVPFMQERFGLRNKGTCVPHAGSR